TPRPPPWRTSPAACGSPPPSGSGRRPTGTTPPSRSSSAVPPRSPAVGRSSASAGDVGEVHGVPGRRGPAKRCRSRYYHRSMEIRDLVVRDLVTVGPAHTLAQAAELMNAHHVGSAIVLTEEAPGILSERDVLRAVAEGADLKTATVGDYMTWNAIVATSEW